MSFLFFLYFIPSIEPTQLIRVSQRPLPLPLNNRWNNKSLLEEFSAKFGIGSKKVHPAWLLDSVGVPYQFLNFAIKEIDFKFLWASLDLDHSDPSHASYNLVKSVVTSLVISGCHQSTLKRNFNEISQMSADLEGWDTNWESMNTYA